MDDLMRNAHFEGGAVWDYESIELVERLDLIAADVIAADVINDWYVDADDVVMSEELPLESRLGSTLFFGSVTLAAVSGMVATFVQ